MSEAVLFTRAGARRGCAAVLALLPGAAAFGLLYGFLAAERGVSSLEIGLMSGLVFAGASQFLALELWRDPVPVLTLVLGVLVINLRHVMMGPVLVPWLRPLGAARTYGSLFFMTDEVWGASVVEIRQGGRDAAFIVGAGATLWVTWVTSSVLGSFAGDISGFIRDWGLAFLTTAFFVALVAGFWRGSRDLLPWGVAAAVALLVKAGIGGSWSILLGALAGSLLGAWREVRRGA